MFLLIFRITLKDNFNQWLSKNLRYPKDAVSRKEQGRVVSKMPAWNPGRKGNKNVATKFMLPISFALN